MSADFTPLAQALKARVISSAGHDTAIFRPMTAAAPNKTPRTGDTGLLTQSPHAAANIELRRDGERISQIRITCRCGDVIEIDCEY